MKLTVSLLAVLTAFAVVVQAGRNFEKLPALDRHTALAARNKALYGNDTPGLRRTCKPKPVGSGSIAPSALASFAGSPLASASTTTSTITISITASTTALPTLSSPASASTTTSTITISITASTTALPTASSPASASTTTSTITISITPPTTALPTASSPASVSTTVSTTALPVSSSSALTPSATSTAPQPPTSNNGTNNNSGGGPTQGLVKVISSNGCGSSGATKEITALSGPNGHIDFLTCGINESGWNPPLFKIESVVTADLSAVAYRDDSTFANCKDFVPTFEKYGSRYGIPAILLASFAMQESSCKPSTVGGAGEQGLMQLTSDKCVGAPKGDCKDVDFNIGAGAKFFSQLLKENDGDLLSCIGHYNGWFKGMTYADATAAAHGGNCREQNNLDYLHQFLNGWCQDVDAYQHNPPLGKYFNLNVCN